MDALTADELRAAVVNGSRSQIKAMPPPPELGALPWEQLDFLGWRDPRAATRGYLVAPHEDGAVGLLLRAPSSRGGRRGSAMCALCRSVRTSADIDLFVAPKAGGRGRAGDSVGTYICSDLACSYYVRGLRPLDLPQGERLPVERRVELLRERVGAFVQRALE